MALKIEGVVDRSMHAEGALSGSSRFEPLHLPFSSPHRLMRILGAIVLPEPLLMKAGQLQLPERRASGRVKRHGQTQIATHQFIFSHQ
jgi:hypothetical protein